MCFFEFEKRGGGGQQLRSKEKKKIGEMRVWGRVGADLTVFLVMNRKRRSIIYRRCVANGHEFVTTDHKSLLSCHQRSANGHLFGSALSQFLLPTLSNVSLLYLLSSPQASFSRGVATCGGCPPVNQGHVGLTEPKTQNTHEMIGWGCFFLCLGQSFCIVIHLVCLSRGE
jgi:hypothetical protein